jgi:hypothetical protein
MFHSVGSVANGYVSMTAGWSMVPPGRFWQSGPGIRPANNSHLSWNLDYSPNIFFETRDFWVFFLPLKVNNFWHFHS